MPGGRKSGDSKAQFYAEQPEANPDFHPKEDDLPSDLCAGAVESIGFFSFLKKNLNN
jgi:hypothetical protein